MPQQQLDRGQGFCLCKLRQLLGQWLEFIRGSIFFLRGLKQRCQLLNQRAFILLGVQISLHYRHSRRHRRLGCVGCRVFHQLVGGLITFGNAVSTGHNAAQSKKDQVAQFFMTGFRRKDGYDLIGDDLTAAQDKYMAAIIVLKVMHVIIDG